MHSETGTPFAESGQTHVQPDPFAGPMKGTRVISNESLTTVLNTALSGWIGPLVPMDSESRTGHGSRRHERHVADIDQLVDDFRLEAHAGAGRPKGMPNRMTIDAREIRRRVIDSWGRVDADAKLDALATENLPAYLRLVAPLLPKNQPPQTTAKWREQLWAAIEEYSTARVRRIAGAVVLVLAAMLRAAREGVLKHVIEGLDTSDLTAQDCRELVADLNHVIKPSDTVVCS